MAATNRTYKLLLLGDAEGKSLFFPDYEKNRDSMIKVDYTSKNLNVDGKEVTVMVWVTDRNYKFEAPTSAYYRGTCGVLIIYDVSDLHSFYEAQYLFQEVENNREREDCVVTLVGVQTDLNETRAISTEDAKNFAENYHMLFVEISPADDKHLEEPLRITLKKVNETHEREQRKRVRLTCDQNQVKSKCF